MKQPLDSNRPLTLFRRDIIAKTQSGEIPFVFADFVTIDGKVENCKTLAVPPSVLRIVNALVVQVSREGFEQLMINPRGTIAIDYKHRGRLYTVHFDRTDPDKPRWVITTTETFAPPAPEAKE